MPSTHGTARRSQLADKARQFQIPTSENHTKGQLVRTIREDLMLQATPKGPDYLGFGKHGAKTYQEVLHGHESYLSVEKMEDQQSDWKIKSFSS